MNQEYSRSPWYDQSIHTERPPVSGKVKPKRKRLFRMLGAIALVLVLILGTTYVFSDSFGISRKEPDYRFSIQPKHSSEVPSESASPQSDSYAEDYRDFFSQYYQQSSTTYGPSSIPRGALNDSLKLILESSEDLPALSLQELYPACIQTVVGIRTRSSSILGGYFWGTGIIFSEDGYILTNQHLVSETNSAEVILFDGNTYPALLIGEDAQTDIAVLKIEADHLQAASFGDSALLSVGDPVVAIGNPLQDSLSGTMTNGIVSAIDRNISVNGRHMTLIQTNTALNEGNSGGPLLNQYGQVIGITNMKMGNAYSSVPVEGIGFAIPSSVVKTVTDQLLATGAFARPGIGITVGPIPEDVASHYQIPSGLYISSVSKGSDAEKNGIVPGDILTHVNGIPVSQTDDVLAIRDQHTIGDSLCLTVYRDGHVFDVNITLYDLNDLY